ncbi:ABC transporter ATP-binding protein [Sporosarcina sp. BI001-red]|uniref:ABC transporter ATP-binding protein n=1 Tax=Sporosarcina sp. BI001-red TaxID=2282866 RepID=UPI000E230FD1|nr:ABC transporter ATP-binding protein [Sporosarcina sp. BI001-red]REB11627.1 ABC transporter ATP-binding protein [Sporosarcina sp. BI001-red]
MNAISVLNLTKSYGRTKAVDSVNLHIKKGELYGFLGRNGAGKSTFINMLTGIIQPTTGEITLLDVKNSSILFKRIGVLPDYTAFYESMTALQHLSYFSSLQGAKKSKMECLTVLEKVGLVPHAAVKVGKYSFGMKKKLGIAQAIINEPDLLILDEPTSGVDAESAIHIQRLLVDLNKKGTTIFMTSHNLDEVEKICTRIAIMKDGRIVNEGTLYELKEKYTKSLEVSMALSERPSSQLLLEATQITGPIETLESTLNFRASNDEMIEEVVRLLVNYGIGVHRISANQPNLEDIFLNG